MKTLTVIMTSYNYAHYLPTSLEAVLNQTFSPLEIIIIDDASSDNSVEIIKSYQKKSPLLHLHQNPQNLGVIATANRAIELAKGDYFVICAADDEILPTFFEKSMLLLEKYPQASICSSIFSVFFNDDRDKLFSYSSLLSKKASFLSPLDFSKALKIKDIHLGGQNTIFKREAVLKAGKLLPQLGPMCDWFLIYTLGLRDGVCFVPEILTKMRMHKNQYTRTFSKNKDFAKILFKEINELLNTPFYNDVRGSFISSGLLYFLGLSITPILFKKSHRKYVNIPLSYHLLVCLLKNTKHNLKFIWIKFVAYNFQRFYSKFLNLID